MFRGIFSVRFVGTSWVTWGEEVSGNILVPGGACWLGGVETIEVVVVGITGVELEELVTAIDGGVIIVDGVALASGLDNIGDD
jgi:hypothetical protein